MSFAAAWDEFYIRSYEWFKEKQAFNTINSNGSSQTTAQSSVSSWMNEEQSGWAHVGTNGEQMEMGTIEDTGTKLQLKLLYIPFHVLLSQGPQQQDLHSPQKTLLRPV